jgi:hypothetical protein
MQLRESKGLQEDRIKALKPARALLESLRLNRDQKFSEYRSITIRNPTKREQQLDEFNRALGRLDRQLEVLSERLKLAQRVNELIEEKAARNEQISKLRDLIEAGKIAQEEQRRKSYTLLSTTTREFLNRDLPREDSFQKAQHVAFDFGKEKISVDGRSAFAASSWVYLKNSFFIFYIALLIEGFSVSVPANIDARWPRGQGYGGGKDSSFSGAHSGIQRSVACSTSTNIHCSDFGP